MVDTIKFQYFYIFELENVSIFCFVSFRMDDTFYHSLSRVVVSSKSLFAVGVTQSVHAKIYIGMHSRSDLKFPEYL